MHVIVIALRNAMMWNYSTWHFDDLIGHELNWNWNHLFHLIVCKILFRFQNINLPALYHDSTVNLLYFIITAVLKYIHHVLVSIAFSLRNKILVLKIKYNPNWLNKIIIIDIPSFFQLDISYMIWIIIWTINFTRLIVSGGRPYISI